jgi:hypothetical protein
MVLAQILVKCSFNIIKRSKFVPEVVFVLLFTIISKHQRTAVVVPNQNIICYIDNIIFGFNNGFKPVLQTKLEKVLLQFLRW